MMTVTVVDDSVVDDGPAGAGVCDGCVQVSRATVSELEMSWEKAKARMFRNAQKTSIWSWNLLIILKLMTGVEAGC